MNPARPDLAETYQISLKLEHYDDIFSDFDMRPYSQRALSVDFLDEVKRAARDKAGGIELLLHVPAGEHGAEHDATIKTRLAAHFERHYGLLLEEKRRVLGLGITMVVLGMIAMLAASFLVFEGTSESLLFSFLVVFLEPAAWFLLWEGMDQIIFHSKNINPDLHFYRKMADPKSRVDFKPY